MATGLRRLCAIVASCPVLAPAVGKTLHAQDTNVPASVAIIQPTALIDSVLAANAQHVYAVSLRQGQHVEISLERISPEKRVGPSGLLSRQCCGRFDNDVATRVGGASLCATRRTLR